MRPGRSRMLGFVVAVVVAVASSVLGAVSPAWAVPPGPALAWGANGSGQLGNGTVSDSKVPVSVSLPAGTTARAVAAGTGHSLALTSSGRVLSWGANNAGQLGNGTTGGSAVPVAVSLPAGTTVTAIAVGDSHSLALTSSGQVLAWGSNSAGQLGTGTGVGSSVPVGVSLPAGTTVTAVAAGTGHSLALTSSGQVLAWGSNSAGQLGNGTVGDSKVPVAVSLPAGTTVTAIAAGVASATGAFTGGNHSLALTSSGQVLAWGSNNAGQLGNGSSDAISSVPVAVSLPAGTTVTAVAAGGNHSLAVTSAGKVLAWGLNFFGQLGNGSSATTSKVPVAASLPTGTTVTAVVAGTGHSLALTSAGKVLAWGSNNAGQLGNGAGTSSGVPVAVSLPAATTVTAIAGEGNHSLAIAQG